MNPLIDLVKRVMGHSSADDPQLVQLSEILARSVADTQRIPNDRRLCYRPFTIARRSGGRRPILAPSEALKQLQRRLLQNYLARQPLHHAVMAFRKRHSVADHARRHVGQAIVLTCDLASFFEHTSANRIRAWFRENGWQGEALRILMRLCVFADQLPQGAPTSPMLSNLVNAELDARLSELAACSGARYSRYADDLAFSWAQPTEPPAFRLAVESCLMSFGYDIQAEKGWRRQHAADRPEVTGVVIHGHRLRPSPAIVRRFLKLMRKSWRQSTDKEVAQRPG